MSPRSAPALAFVLVLMLPLAAATGEEVRAFANDVAVYVDGTVASVREIAESSPIFAPPEESEAESESQASSSEPPAESAQPAREAPPSSSSSQSSSSGSGGLLAPVTRLVPIPMVGEGVAPRVDVVALLSVIEDVPPLAPAPAPASAPAKPTVSAPDPMTTQTATLDPVAAPVLPLAAAAVTAAAAAGGATSAANLLWERARRFAWFALLYSRIPRERLLDHGSRERLLEVIRARPGLAVTDLAEATGAPRNTVTYHLRVLERERLVSSTRSGRNRLFFAPGAMPQRAPEGEPAPSRAQVAAALGTIRHETTLAVALAIGETPGVGQKALCQRIGVSPSLAHWHADRLVASGVVDKRREGRSVRYYPGASFELVKARSG